jgi:beta-lactamase class A
MENVNAAFRRMGLEKTVVRRLLFDSEASARGLENTICPREMGMLLEQLYRGEFVTQEVSRYALDILLDQQIGHKLEGKLTGVQVAHKTGEDDGLSNDVGIVFAKEPFVICFAGHDTDVYRWEDLIRRSAYDLVQAQEI